jgi:Uma2 family endonuclease
MAVSQALTVEDIILQTDAFGAPVRLEYVRGRTKWEASPASRHQMTVDRIRESLKRAGRPGAPEWGCHSLADVLVRFRDPARSLKRPDIAIFCEGPPESDEALDLLPAAVIEIISLGYEEKDLGNDGAPFYIEQGIADVLVVDPRTSVVLHYRPGQPRVQHSSPVELDLACGCRVRV